MSVQREIEGTGSSESNLRSRRRFLKLAGPFSLALLDAAIYSRTLDMGTSNQTPHVYTGNTTEDGQALYRGSKDWPLIGKGVTSQDTFGIYQNKYAANYPQGEQFPIPEVVDPSSTPDFVKDKARGHFPHIREPLETVFSTSFFSPSSLDPIFEGTYSKQSTKIPRISHYSVSQQKDDGTYNEDWIILPTEQALSTNTPIGLLFKYMYERIEGIVATCTIPFQRLHLDMQKRIYQSIVGPLVPKEDIVQMGQQAAIITLPNGIQWTYDTEKIKGDTDSLDVAKAVGSVPTIPAYPKSKIELLANGAIRYFLLP